MHGSQDMLWKLGETGTGKCSDAAAAHTSNDDNSDRSKTLFYGAISKNIEGPVVNSSHSNNENQSTKVAFASIDTISTTTTNAVKINTSV